MRDVKFSSHIVINASSTALHPISTVSNIFSRKQSHPKKNPPLLPYQITLRKKRDLKDMHIYHKEMQIRTCMEQATEEHQHAQNSFSYLCLLLQGIFVQS
jgi:hypothetical protein